MFIILFIKHTNIEFKISYTNDNDKISISETKEVLEQLNFLKFEQ